MKRMTIAFLFACFLALSAVEAHAQEMMKAKKMENHAWHQVVLVKFTPGGITEAKEIIKNHFEKAGIASNTRGPQILEMKSGEWDMMFVWTLDSVADLDWEVHPEDEKWWAALAKQEGGEDKAMKVMNRYLSLVRNSTSYLATSEKPAM